GQHSEADWQTAAGQHSLVEDSRLLDALDGLYTPNLLTAGTPKMAEQSCSDNADNRHVEEKDQKSSQQNGCFTWFHGEWIDNPNTHGTGCTLSSAVASNLALGYSLEESIFRAKQYLSNALAAMLDLGKGSGPLNHIVKIPGL
ncbi:MAG: bifunctional hydroxymethylpyrimidine kinase/phosphomethylpyrimidine kinase, partial [Lachnospiraceae bacterium]|nr:bifunctional hydroxymethylpyrimidine kinase/phosphomethylpyrimidine kinase [Lachnospiraceae bacterium]